MRGHSASRYWGLVLLFLCCSSLVDASITIVDSGKHIVSKPDRKLGPRLLKGYQYMAHLQYIPGNLALCGGANLSWNVTYPRDQVPVALLVSGGGGCSVEDKARAASTQIYPPGVVRYIIVDGSKNIDDAASAKPGDDELLDDDYDLHPLAVAASDDEPVPIPAQRSLRKKRNDDITVAVLHVSYDSGFTLLDTVVHEHPEIRASGGSKVLLDGQGPTASARTIFLWTFMSAFTSAIVCCCFMLFVDHNYREEERPQPQRRERRRLTREQVQENLPIFEYNQVEHGEAEEGVCHECSICLDEFEDGNRMRRLPCEHIFHSRCIAKWLIERSATCPLCKIDLYEEEEEDENSSDEEPSVAPADNLAGQPIPTWWGDSIWRMSETSAEPSQPSGWWWRRRRASQQEAEASAVGSDVNPSGRSSGLWNRILGRVTTAGPAVTELTEPLLPADNMEETTSALPVQADANTGNESAEETVPIATAGAETTDETPANPTNSA